MENGLETYKLLEKFVAKGKLIILCLLVDGAPGEG
jgi:hypothetical protein